MKKPGHWSKRGSLGRWGYTLMEVMVAASVATGVTAGALVFMNFARVSASGIAGQAMVSDNAANAILFIKSRIRPATSVAVNASGNTLTLGFDDDFTTDSDADGSPYNDKDHYEEFRFTGTNVTDAAKATANRMIYVPKVGVTGSSVLVRFGVRNLPTYKIFTIPNPNTVIMRFGVVDTNARDYFQSVDIQAMGVALNRPVSKNVISISL